MPFVMDPWSTMSNLKSMASPEGTIEERMARAFRDRYGEGNVAKGLMAFRDEIGARPAIEDIGFMPPEVMDGDLGRYYPDTKKIIVQKKLPKDIKLATLAHEIAHAADNAEDPLWQYQESSHFKYFPGEQEDALADSLAEQNAIEKGWPKNPQITNNMPWLERVQPLSSNKLANPWTRLK